MVSFGCVDVDEYVDLGPFGSRNPRPHGDNCRMVPKGIIGQGNDSGLSRIKQATGGQMVRRYIRDGSLFRKNAAGTVGL